MKIIVKIWLVVLVLLIISGCQSTDKRSWKDLEDIVKSGQQIALSNNYQDYWLDWSGDSNKIVALAIDKKFGVHCVDLNKMNFTLDDDLFIPEPIGPQIEPLIWKAPIKTEPMNQASPCWSKKGDYIGYVEYTPADSEVRLIHLKTKTMQVFSFKEVGRITGIDFAWTKPVLAIYGKKGVLVYNLSTSKIDLLWKSTDEINMAHWFPKDEALLLIMNYGEGYKLDLAKKEPSSPKYWFEEKINSCCFVPNKTEIVLSDMDRGLFVYNYETKKRRRLTRGYDYAPRVSPNGKWVSFISESPYTGGFVVKLN